MLAGVKRVQMSSFVHPKLVPQMADAEAVCLGAHKQEGVIYSGLVLNVKGVERAIKSGLNHVAISMSASDTHSRKNANKSLDEALIEFSEMARAAKEADLTVRGGIQCAFGCRYEGQISEQFVIDLAKKHLDLGLDELSLAVVTVDGIMASDTTAPYAIKSFQDMNGTKLWDAKKCTFVIDHALPVPNERIANLHKFMRDFAVEQNIRLFDIGEGICHQLIVEKDLVRPGQVFIGADSNTCTYGALNAFSTGVGSSDLAAVMLIGKIWLKVPETLKVNYKGILPE